MKPLVEKTELPATYSSVELALEDALELQKRLVIEPDTGQVGDRDTGHMQAVLDCARRECSVTLSSC
jgi:hypothetical protein